MPRRRSHWLSPRGVERASLGARDIINLEQLVTEDIGEEIFALAAKLFPICRSITGNGVRETLREIGAHIALEMHEVPTGTIVFDWTIPREWNIRDAYTASLTGHAMPKAGSAQLTPRSCSAE